MTQILPPFGTNPPSTPRSTFSGDLQSRQVYNDPRELWYLSLPSKLSPKNVLMILRSALGGDIWQQWQLFSLMLDSWPMLRKCVHELRSAVAQTKFVVRPFSVAGEEPSTKAKKKADVCGEAIQSMRPEAASDEKGFTGLIYDLTDAFVTGICMIEIMWQESADIISPRAATWIHPRHFSFTTTGRLAITLENYGDYGYPDADKFIVAQYMSKSGSSLGSGMLRPLAWWWSAIMYNREWMLQFAQRFGQPFRWTTYAPGTPDAEVAKINDMMANMGNESWANFPKGTEFTLHPPGTLGPQNPHVAVIEEANKDCQLLLLGQTLTSEVHDSGSRALGTVHSNVRRERVEEIAQWIGRVLSEQLMRSVCRLNFGDDDECPTCEPDFTEVADPTKTAQRYQILLGAKMPIVAEEAYRDNSLTMPEEGDLVIMDGKLGVLGALDQVIDPAAPPPVPFSAEPGKNGEPNGSPRFSDGDLNAMARVFAARPRKRLPAEVSVLLRKAGPLIARATARDLKELRGAVREVVEATDDDFLNACRRLRARLVEFVKDEPVETTRALEATTTAAVLNGMTTRRI